MKTHAWPIRVQLFPTLHRSPLPNSPYDSIMGLRNLVFLKGPTMRFGQPTLAVGSLLSPLKTEKLNANCVQWSGKTAMQTCAPQRNTYTKGPWFTLAKTAAKRNDTISLCFTFTLWRADTPNPRQPHLPCHASFMSQNHNSKFEITCQ